MLRVRRLTPGILDRLSPLDLGAGGARGGWTSVGTRRTLTGVAVLAVGYRGLPPSLIVMLPQTDAGATRLRRHAEVAAALRREPRLQGWSALVPRPIEEGVIAGQYYLASQALPGTPAVALLSDPIERSQLLVHATRTITDLHERTAQLATIGPALLERWIDFPVLAIRRALEANRYGADAFVALDDLRERLRASVAGRRVKIGWIHGDFWPGNLLVSANGAISGIIDWDRAAADELPGHDALHVVLYTKKLIQGVELGAVICSALRNSESMLLRGVPGAHKEGASTEIDARTMLLLYWLRFVAASLAQSGYFAANKSWVKQDIVNVLRVA